MAAGNRRLPPAVVGANDSRRPNPPGIFTSRSISSPPAFGNGNSGFLEGKGRFLQPLVINEGGLPKKIISIASEGKGKEVIVDNGFLQKNGIAPKVFTSIPLLDVGASSSRPKEDAKDVVLDHNKLDTSDLQPVNNKIAGTLAQEVNQILLEEDIGHNVDKANRLPGVDGVAGIEMPYSKAVQNGMTKKGNINVTNLDFGSNFTDEGSVVKILASKELENSSKLRKSLVIKVFGNNISFQIIAMELRRQWSQFGKFHLTMLGLGWVLCAFEETERLEEVLANGPWFVRGNIIGMDRWSPSFSPLSLKGISAPVWIRMPNLPLQCWDEINVCRIASLVGKPYLLDGNMFQWNRREFARICVRLDLDSKLSLGVWVEGCSGKFFQKIEYEKIPNLCFNCGKIGHLNTHCPLLAGQSTSVGRSISDEIEDRGAQGNDSGGGGYGPWVHVNFRNNKIKNQRSKFVWKRNYGNGKKIVDVPSISDRQNLETDVAVGNVNDGKEAGSEGKMNETLNSDLQDHGMESALGMDSIPDVITNNKFKLLNEEVEDGEIRPGQPVYFNEPTGVKEVGWEGVDVGTSVEPSDSRGLGSKKKNSRPFKGLGFSKMATRSRKLEGGSIDTMGTCPPSII
ncbi:hypothetical protein M5K25_003688 [Dendrobium thyrsiflorum]|uniref:CCHC-type domain-containing protein n=1 Tax=Dendrobium thyrsiflorum TaxID=117978 RepID=A0ABD0VJV8_DENTH